MTLLVKYWSITFIFLLHAMVFCNAQRSIMAIGDSNGTSETGWVNQLKSMRPQDSIFNYSISGNTIGFDNLGNEKLNTLKNIKRYLKSANIKSSGKGIDDVIILLGTNDCKKVFEGREEEVLENMKSLVVAIKTDHNLTPASANIYMVTPPPVAPDTVLLDKYKGGDKRLQKLLPGFMSIAFDKECFYVDIYNELYPTFHKLHIDGIHLNALGSKMVATSISKFLDKTPTVSWDNSKKYTWPIEVKVVDILSPMDGEQQKAYFYRSKKSEPQPLIVSLHTWSGDYTQHDPMLDEIIENDWNYIHPDFRGANNTPKSCGSRFAIDDIEQAISFAVDNANVSEGEIHVIGASGGGYATLCTFMNSKHAIASFSAWVPISDIEAWFYQSVGRKNTYAGHILAATSSMDSILNIGEARLRSPMYMDTPINLRNSSLLNIYAGIHDGYSGSVPISQSLNFYNKVIQDFGAEERDMISVEEINDLMSMRTYPDKPGTFIGDRPIIFHRQLKNISITIFEGKHEMLTEVALKLIPTDHEE